MPITSVHRREGKPDASPTMPSLVHFFPKSTDSDATTLEWSPTLSHGASPSGNLSSSPRISRMTWSTLGPGNSKTTGLSSFRADGSLGPKTQTLLSQDPETHVAGEGEDYFLSLFGDSKKLISRSSHVQETCKHFSMILEEVGQSISSSLGDIKIAEVNVMGLFVKLVNSSRDKELDIGGHTLQQNVNGQPVSLYCFVPNTVMQANSMVTVWAAASEGKHQPPSDFVWKEQVKFQSTPDCTTILCKPSGEAVAWYTPIHWKQAWEKLETDIEFDRCSVVTPTFRRHVFRWTASETTMTKEKQDEPKEDPTGPQEEQGLQEKEIPPSLFPNRSPWCNSPCAPAHPYSPLIDPHKASCTRSSSRPRPQPAKPSPAPGKSLLKSQCRNRRKCEKARQHDSSKT
uniref:LTD domain-containing protein n=1 Tax=Castor canadensis TaxID=51338 RepID=A0A8C0ZSK2_CASCN